MRPTSSQAARRLDARPSRWMHPLASGGLACSEGVMSCFETLPRGRRETRTRPEDTRGQVAEDSKTIPDAQMVT